MWMKGTTYFLPLVSLSLVLLPPHSALCGEIGGGDDGKTSHEARYILINITHLILEAFRLKLGEH